MNAVPPPAASGIAIAGAGPAGSAAAILLARAGRAVTLVERDRAPAHKVCGEFISPEAVADLHALGLDLAGLGAQRIARLRLVRGARLVESPLPFTAASLTRRTLDAALQALAESSGATLLRGRTVRALRAHALDLDDGTTLPADAVLLATGKHDLRAHRRAPPRATPPLVGFKTYWRLAPAQSAALSGHVEVLLFPRLGRADAGGGTYGGLQPVEGGAANLCLLVSRARLDAAAGRWDAVLDALYADCPHLRTRLHGATPLLDRPLTIAGVPYGYVHRGPSDGLFRVGDQACVIPSFTGDGMAIALHGARLAARTILSGGTPDDHARRLRADVARPMRAARALSALGRTGAGQGALMAACATWPGVIRAAALATRVSQQASMGSAQTRKGSSDPLIPLT
ncbi:MAG: NAD(P)/FAD-dependent oxidoreductase [Janthinobacterium lividum]